MKGPDKRQQLNEDGNNPPTKPQSSVSFGMRVRAGIVAGFFALFSCLLIFNLFNLQVIDEKGYAEQAEDQQLKDETITPNRGVIYDTNMKVLARSATVWDVTASTRDMATYGTDIYTVAQNLSQILEMDETELVTKLMENPDSNYVLIKRKVEKPVADAITSWMDEYNNTEGNEDHPITGIYLTQTSKRYYPYGNLASSVLGFTNVDGNGVTGLELYYNETLKGVEGRILSTENAWGYELANNNYQAKYDAQDGYSLVTTIDETIQSCLEKYLYNAVVEHNVERGMGIVMNVNTGEIYGMATEPDFNLNDPYTLYDTELANQIAAIEDTTEQNKQLQAAWQSMWRNRAVSDILFPGSVFKVITASAALDSGKATVDTTFEACTGRIKVASNPDVYMNCAEHSGHGVLNLAQGLDNSCNPYFIQLGWQMGADTFCDYLQAFGFTERTGIDMYDEAVSQTVSRENMTAVSLASSAFGQTSAVTPIAMITAISAAVNGGNLVQPHVVRQVLDSDGNIVETIGTTVKRQVISETTSQTICSILEDSVDNGHGKNAHVPGYRVGGKSGTSQKNQGLSGEDDEQTYIASFVGFAPADDPEIAVLIVLDNPNSPTGSTYGGSLAGPVVQNILSETLPYLGFEPEYTEEELAVVASPVPDVVGALANNALSTLHNAGFNGKIVGSGTTVTYQYPAAGISVNRQSTIILYTDEGATGTMVQVPNVVGQSIRVATEMLEAAGLNISITGTNDESSGTVVAALQRIEPGTEVEMGTVVEVEFHDTSATD